MARKKKKENIKYEYTELVHIFRYIYINCIFMYMKNDKLNNRAVAKIDR